MGILTRLFGQQAASSEPAAFLPGPGRFDLPIVGESHYQTELEAICGGRTDEGADVYIEATLILEDSNPYDSEAVRVDIDGRPVGHLSREHAREYRKRLAEAGHPRLQADCKAHVVGGSRGKRHFGVYLDLPVND